ncbi:MAG: hypothetical protein JWP69_2076 [Flaviaesturariibacter sp.]|nr:hypothetical protein [Flaviaesturariibacter sp.]
MKRILTLCCLFICGFVNAQDVTGLYTGTVYNDTTKMVQIYELALSEYRGKITGYAYTTFVLDDKNYYGIRRIKAAKRDGKLLIEDDKMLANNFPQAPDKGVKRLTIIPLAGIDTVTTLNGHWQTNRTRQFYSVSGSLDLKKSNDSTNSALIAHLKELNLIGGESDVADVKIKTREDKTKIKVETKPNVKPIQPIGAVTTPFAQRQNKMVQAITITADSIELSLYDNGVVDGDIVSVYLNGAPIMPNTKLLEQASKLTIQIPKADTDYEIKLVAENLGVLPPNTGLLIIQSGENRHRVYFSADLRTNASIIIRKKP